MVISSIAHKASPVGYIRTNDLDISVDNAWICIRVMCFEIRQIGA